MFDSFRARPWEFIQSVGGMAVGQPIRRSPEKVFLPVRCDVSGLSDITRKPTTMNSGLVVKEITARIEDREILLSLKAGMPTAKQSSSQCEGVELTNAQAGDYQVFYSGSDGGKHLLGAVKVP